MSELENQPEASAPAQSTWDPETDAADYYAAAAVLDAFDPFTWQPVLGRRPGGEMPPLLSGSDREELLERLLIDCEQILDGPLHGLWRMTFAARRAQLRRLGDAERMRERVKMTEERPSSPAQRMFELLISEKLFNLQDLPRDDLAALVTVRGWLDGILDNMPRRGDLMAALSRADLLAPMRRLVRHGFVNREQELAQLRDYAVGPQEAAHETPLFVFGSGGVGKSTLLAQFVLADVQESGAAFAYVDMDRPTVRPEEPLTILLEIITQLQEQLQFDPVTRNDLTYGILDDMDRLEAGRVLESLGSMRGYPYHARQLDGAIRQAAKRSEGDYLPPVIIVDTFEEAQWFGRTVVTRLLELLFALHEIGTCRLLISGRVLADEFLQRAYSGLVTVPANDSDLLQEELADIPLPQRPLNVNVLDEAASRELLDVAVEQAALPPLTTKEQDDIIGIVSRNPMCLKLAVRLLLNEGIEKLRARRSLFLAQLKAEKIQALLYGRILNHIKKGDVRQVAYPGLVVRRITVEVIREVLAGPCKLKLTPQRDAEAIFKDMRREAALVVFNQADNSLRHRPDVRRAMLLDLTDHVDKDTVHDIDRAAVAYYARFDDSVSRAEEIYHRLRLHEPGEALDGRWLPEAAQFLKDAGEELPAVQRLWLAKWLNITLDDDVRQEANQEEWEDQAVRLVERHLAGADPEKALDVLAERADRLPRSRLYNLQAEAYRILGSYDQALLIGREGVDALIEAGDSGLALDLLLKMVVIEESRGRLAAADSLLYEAENVAGQISDPVKKLRTQITRLRVERKLRQEARARRADLRRAALAVLDRDLLAALDRYPVLLREAAGELALHSPELAAVAIDTLGLETATNEQARALGQVLSVLSRQSDAQTQSSSEDAEYLERWRSTTYDPIVIQEWVRAHGKDLARRLRRQAAGSPPGAYLLREMRAYFRAGEDIVLAEVGKTFQAAGRSGEARKIYEQTLQTMRRSGDRAGEARTLSNLAEISRIESNPDEALALLTGALAIWRELGVRAEEARTLYDYAVVCQALRRRDDSLAYFHEALAIFRVLGEEVREAVTLQNLAALHADLGELEKALDYFERVLAIYRSQGDRTQEAKTLNVMGEIVRENGRLPQARLLYSEALDLWRAIGDGSSEADTLIELAGVAEAEGRVQEALKLYESSLQIMQELGASERKSWIEQELDRLNREVDAHQDEADGRLIGWNEIRRTFREALISAFNWNGLKMLLRYHSDRDLDRITSESAGFVKNVDDVIENAVRESWLDELAMGALEKNQTHSGLKATVPQIMNGIEKYGPAYYQGDVGAAGRREKEPQQSGAEPDRDELYQELVKKFNLEELKYLSFNLEVDFDELGGSGRSAKARELVLYMERRGRLNDLAQAIAELR